MTGFSWTSQRVKKIARKAKSTTPVHSASWNFDVLARPSAPSTRVARPGSMVPSTGTDGFFAASAAVAPDHNATGRIAHNVASPASTSAHHHRYSGWYGSKRPRKFTLVARMPSTSRIAHAIKKAFCANTEASAGLMTGSGGSGAVCDSDAGCVGGAGCAAGGGVGAGVGDVTGW